MVKWRYPTYLYSYITEIQQSHNGTRRTYKTCGKSICYSRGIYDIGRITKTKRTLFYLEITSCFTIGARARGLIKEDGRRREAGPSPRNQGTSDTLWSGSSGGAVRSIEGRWSYCSRDAQQRAVQGRSRLCHISFLETALISVCSEAQTREREMHPQQYVFMLIIIMSTHKADSGTNDGYRNEVLSPY